MESDTPRTDANCINVDYETREPDGEPSQVIEEVVLANFARELERELAAAIKQRDEARRDACSFEAIVRWNEAHPKGFKSPAELFRIARQIAVERGWDCFKEGGGA